MASPVILERLRRALAPEHSVELELASGGMGSVFLGHDHALDRPVAIKLLRPELASALAAERFLTEARTLAGLQHPNIVNIYRVGEGEGLFYYVMEYVPGETLEERLKRGPMRLDGATKMGRDLLDGLEAAHRAGVVHRDVKPSNLMILGRRTLLTDFGIAIGSGKGAADGFGTGYTGTPGYMAPEQLLGEPATPRTDIFCAGVVLYQAITGRRWYEHIDDWRGVPYGVAAVLKRALAPTPADRWPDAASFRRALWRTRSRRYLHRTIGLTVGGLGIGALLALGIPRLGAGPYGDTSPLTVVVPPFQVAGSAAEIGDSLATLVRSALTSHPDFTVLDEAPSGRGPVMEVSAHVTAEGERLRVRPLGAFDGRGAVPIGSEISLPRGDLALMADTIADLVLRAVWDESSPIRGSLPSGALPRSQVGLANFLSAERLVAAGNWGEAKRAYERTLSLDPTCWICAWRITDVQRWLGEDRDPVYLDLALTHIDSFPLIYRSLVRSASLPLAQRIDTLEAATLDARGFFLPGLQLGDELFHRGPLIGRTRREAATVLETAARLRPDYAPTWEHLLWARIPEGDSAGAAEAWAALDGFGEVRDPFSGQLRVLLQLGLAWRFFDPATADRLTRQVLGNRSIAADPNLGAGPRMLPTFDAPAGAVAMGALLIETGRSDLVRSGTIAMLLGQVALGKLDAANGTARRYRTRGDRGAELFTAELAALLWRFDRAAHPDSAALATLTRLAAEGASAPLERKRAQAMRLLLVGSGERSLPSFGAPFDDLLRADRLARQGDPTGALALTDSLARDPALGVLDPFLRTAVHLMRAEWFVAINNFEGARRELRWHENTDLLGYPVGAPQAGEVDWAFGTLGRWLRAAVIERIGVTGDELCSVYRGVERHWKGGDSVFVARADSARRRADQLSCPVAR